MGRQDHKLTSQVRPWGGRCGHVERGRTGQNREKNRGGDSLGEGTGREDDREEEKGEEREVASWQICNVSKVEKSWFRVMPLHVVQRYTSGRTRSDCASIVLPWQRPNGWTYVRVMSLEFINNAGFGLLWYASISFGNCRIRSNIFKEIYYGSISFEIIRPCNTHFSLGFMSWHSTHSPICWTLGSPWKNSAHLRNSLPTSYLLQ